MTHAAVPEPADPAALARELAREGAAGGRTIVAIAGAPGSGKTTLAIRIVEELKLLGIGTATLPMDGFHLSNRVLVDLGRRERKGAIDTFDGVGFVTTLRRAREDRTHVLYVPGFDHGGGEPIAASIAIPPTAAVVVAEGNYLLDASDPWSEVASLVDHAWFVDVDDDLRRRRLVARHVATGKAPEAAVAWVERVDEVNARRIKASSARAERILRVD